MSRKIRMREVCERAGGVGPDTIRRWVKAGQFPKPGKLGRTLLFDEQAVEQALRNAAQQN